MCDEGARKGAQRRQRPIEKLRAGIYVKLSGCSSASSTVYSSSARNAAVCDVRVACNDKARLVTKFDARSAHAVTTDTRTKPNVGLPGKSKNDNMEAGVRRGAMQSRAAALLGLLVQ